MAGVSLRDFVTFQGDRSRHLSAILVNQHLYEDVIKVSGKPLPPVFPVRMRLSDRLRRRISRLPARSAVLIVSSDEDFPQTGGAFLRHCEHLFGRKGRFRAKRLSEIPNLISLLHADVYRLFLFSPLVWEQLPERVKRMAVVARAVSDPDPRSLEEIRIAAGVLL